MDVFDVYSLKVAERQVLHRLYSSLARQGRLEVRSKKREHAGLRSQTMRT